MLYHMLNLILHSYKEQYDKVQEKNGPKDRHIEHFEKRHSNADEDSFGTS